MDKLGPFVAYANVLSPAQWCQTMYILIVVGIVTAHMLPNEMRKSLTDYGARRPPDGKQSDKKEESKARKFVALLTSYGQLPHWWFYHFYIASVAFSVFWGAQFLLQGSVMKTLAEIQSRSGDDSSVELGRTFVVWVMMVFQGSRRLYECLFVNKPGKSPMWAPLWVLGLAFYTAMHIAIWIQGSDAILRAWESPQEATVDITSMRVLVGVPVFVFAWVNQFRCHKHLASLKKYTLPSEIWFQYIVCPHYTFECLIYLSIAFIAAPPGGLFNKTVLSGLTFSVVALGSTAQDTKQWYANKFGADKVAGRWNMIPFVF